ncbi:MAG: hypothetical protein KC736_00670 [Candidatus Moranbacteria bacterium]|nr:hypothetical protein [Candidatus Moranbacteria bacterium]
MFFVSSLFFDSSGKEVYFDELSHVVPEFFLIPSTFAVQKIIRPRPEYILRYPVSAKVENGHLVCAKKKDKPSFSKKTKHKHLDLECCLDPDEWPNPYCTYR